MNKTVWEGKFGHGCTTRTEVCYVYEGYVGSAVVLYM